MVRRVLATAALAASLVLSMLPPLAEGVDAAPPEVVREATAATPEDVATESEDVTTDSTVEPGAPPSIPQSMPEPLPGTEEHPGEDGPSPEGMISELSSVRSRGLEAPVELKAQAKQVVADEQAEQPDEEETERTATSRQEKRDPGDGRVRKRDQASSRDKEQNRPPRGLRVWPMPADSYTFTQQFGCVPQLGNLYFPGAGCPAEAPVIHTGIDLAAPEGTLFYAAASGWVTLAGYDRPTADANTRIIIQHDGPNERYATDYLHWIASYVKEGDYVHAGDPIGEVGSVGFSTGPHLHFSVTDLDMGEHIDPLRWLPEEPALEGYVSRRPAAQLRLPPGTTAGQPESADPAPPPPPVREDVPKNPPDESRGDRSEKRDERKAEKRRGENRGESASDTSDRSGKKRNRDDATSSEDSGEPAGEKKTERERSRERERTRERNKDGSRSEAADSGEDVRNRDDGGSGNNRRDRDARNDSGSQEEREGASDKRDRRDDDGQSDSDGRDQGNEERQDRDHDSSGRDKRDNGGGKAGAKSANTGDEAPGDDNSADLAAGDRGGAEDGERNKRDRGGEGDALVATPPANERPDRGHRDRRGKS